MEKKVCRKCNADFIVADDDLVFYRKIGTPTPTWCPECRRVRRFVWRNERSLYRNKCAATGKEVISSFSPDKPIKIYDQSYWFSDAWSPLDYGREYDFSRSFFEQWRDLYYAVPQINVSNKNVENSEFCNVNSDSKDSYLISAAYENERVMYGNRVGANRDSLDLYIANNNEYCYELVAGKNCYKVFWGQDCTNCSDCYFIYDCQGCRDCVGCTGLRNKQYYIFNQPYDKAAYERKVADLDLRSRAGLERTRVEFEKLRAGQVRKFANLVNCENSTGDNLEGAKNCHECYDLVNGLQNCRYAVWGGYQMSDVYDASPGVGANSSVIYEAFDAGINSNDIQFVGVVHNSSNVRYSLNCYSSKNLFGCVGLSRQENCILNRRYPESEYGTMVERIKRQMMDLPYVDRLGREYRYGEFFPPEMSPYGYNETVAQEYYPIDQSVAVECGFNWSYDVARNVAVTKKAGDLPESVDELRALGEGILREVIECEHKGECNEQCTIGFKILPQELAFYLEHGLPLPKLCFNCRHYARVKLRNPMRLWKRQCDNQLRIKNEELTGDEKTQRCPNMFETTYAPEREEKVYCEKCYQNSVV
ncbi:hypothetical protein KJ855_01000 [Patescibacteria group bacterium]|nr:hypothetical protein [Patescibacteria group bacterium]